MLQLNNVSLSFDGKTVLDSLTCSFEEGCVSALVGGSGVGKTSILRLLCGLIKPTHGKVESDHTKISYVFQEPRLFSHLSAKQNVMLVGCDEARACALLGALGLAEDVDRYPDELSGGMQQRVTIARALAAESTLLLLDEPFRGLDPDTKRIVAETVFDTARGRTVVLVTHDEAELAYADRVYRLLPAPHSILLAEKSANGTNE